MKILPRTIKPLTTALLLAMTMWLPCFGQVTTGDIEGKVTNEQGVLLPNATILIKNQETGIVRQTSSTSNGRYRVAALNPGVYEITAKLAGFVIEIQKDVLLAVGQVFNIDFQLTQVESAGSQIMEVTGKAPLIETSESMVSNVINEEEIRNLPLNSRNVVELALLSPGVSAFRSATPAFSPLNFGATNNRSTRVFVDGLDFSSDALGGILPPGAGVSLNSVEQFEVVSGVFEPEYGLTDGGIINLITQSGTNQFHGNAFLLLRDDALNSTLDDFQPLPYERQQFGFSIGGPFVRDRTHFFAAYEKNRENPFSTVNTNDVFPELEGTFEVPQRNSNFIAKLNHQLSSDQGLTAKYAYRDFRNDTGFGGSSAKSTGIRLAGNLNHLLLSHTWLALDGLLIDSKFGYLQSEFQIDPFDNGPHLIYPSAQLGRFPGGKQRIDEDRWQLRSDISYYVPNMHGEHNWKFGFDISRVTTAEAFDSLATGLFIFGDDSAPLPFLAVIGEGNPNFGSILNYKLAFYLQDDWSPFENVTFNLGLRYDIETNATNQNYFSSKTDPTLPFIVKGNRPIDKNNFAPRIGFAWNPFRSYGTVVRGSYGIFYGRVPADFANGEIRSDQYRFYTIFFPGTTNKEEINLDGLPYQLEWLLPEKVPIPYTEKFSIGFSKQLSDNYAIDFDYLGARGFHEYFARRDINLPGSDGTRPLPQYQEVFLLRADGRSFYDALEVIFRSRLGRNHQLRASYTLSKAENDFDEPHFAGQLFKRGPAIWDERHRLTLDAQILFRWDIRVSGILTMASGRPFNVFTGNDENRNGDLSDDQPPGVGRNSERTDGYSNVDLRVSKSLRFKPYEVELMADFFNLFNQRNFDPGSYVGNLNSPNFDQPTATLPPRQIQLGTIFRF